MRIAAYIQDKHLEGVLVFLLEKNFKVQVELLNQVSDLEKALNQSQQGIEPQIELLVLEGLMSDELRSSSLRLLLSSVPRISFENGQILGVYPHEDQQQSVVSQNSHRNFVEAIEGWMRQGLLPFEVSDSTQCRIRTDLLLEVAPLQGDLYVRLSHDKFVRLFKKGDVFDYDDMVKYTLKRGIQYLYIPREQCAEFASRYAAIIIQRIQEKKGVYLAVETTEKAQSVMEAIHQLTHEVGFTQEVQDLTKAQLKLVIEVVRHSRNLGQMIRHLAHPGSQYIAAHSTLCAFLSCMIANQLQWASNWTYQKLVLASFLHDLPISNQELAALGSLSELEAMKSRFTSQELENYKSHPEQAAGMARQMSEIPSDVDLILLQHHERPDGSGFPQQLNQSSIAPLSALFIIAHDLSTYLMNTGGDLDLTLFFQDTKAVYQSGQFKKVFIALEKMVSQKVF